MTVPSARPEMGQKGANSRARYHKPNPPPFFSSPVRCCGVYLRKCAWLQQEQTDVNLTQRLSPFSPSLFPSCVVSLARVFTLFLAHFPALPLFPPSLHSVFLLLFLTLLLSCLSYAPEITLEDVVYTRGVLYIQKRYAEILGINSQKESSWVCIYRYTYIHICMYIRMYDACM